MGDMGILRAGIFNHQGGCWQDACNYIGSQRMIMEAADDPVWTREFLDIILDYKLRFIDSLRGCRIDLLEDGGGDGSMSVISPRLFKDFCVPYAQKMSDAPARDRHQGCVSHLRQDDGASTPDSGNARRTPRKR